MDELDYMCEECPCFEECAELYEETGEFGCVLFDD